jgi:2-oxoglutarate dehydrogenase E1 component
MKTLVSVLVNSTSLPPKEKNERKDVAIVRIEQLFPLPAQLEIIAKYPNADDYVWAQEPKNMCI